MSTIQEFDFSVDLMQVLLWRFNSAPFLTALVQSKQNWYNANHQQFWENWYTNVFNLDTANEFGCAVWAIILGLPVNLGTGTPSSNVPFGFGSFNQNFFNSNFSPMERDPVYLTVAQRIIILKLRYYQMTSRGTFLVDNQFLAKLFGFGNAYIIDNLDMTSTFKYKNSVISSGMMALIEQFDLIPRPSTMAMTYIGS